MSSLDNIVARLGQATAQAEEATAAYKGAIMNVGYKLYRAFEASVTLTQVNEAVQFSVGGIFYRWDGVFPQGGLVVPQNTPEPSPDQTGAGKYIAVLDLQAMQFMSRVYYAKDMSDAIKNAFGPFISVVISSRANAPFRKGTEDEYNSTPNLAKFTDALGGRWVIANTHAVDVDWFIAEGETDHRPAWQCAADLQARYIRCTPGKKYTFKSWTLEAYNTAKYVLWRAPYKVYGNRAEVLTEPFSDSKKDLNINLFTSRDGPQKEMTHGEIRGLTVRGASRRQDSAGAVRICFDQFALNRSVVDDCEWYGGDWSALVGVDSNSDTASYKTTNNRAYNVLQTQFPGLGADSSFFYGHCRNGELSGNHVYQVNDTELATFCEVHESNAIVQNNIAIGVRNFCFLDWGGYVSVDAQETTRTMFTDNIATCYASFVTPTDANHPFRPGGVISKVNIEGNQVTFIPVFSGKPDQVPTGIFSPSDSNGNGVEKVQDILISGNQITFSGFTDISANRRFISIKSKYVERVVFTGNNVNGINAGEIENYEVAGSTCVDCEFSNNRIALQKGNNAGGSSVCFVLRSKTLERFTEANNTWGIAYPEGDVRVIRIKFDKCSQLAFKNPILVGKQPKNYFLSELSSYDLLLSGGVEMARIPLAVGMEFSDTQSGAIGTLKANLFFNTPLDRNVQVDMEVGNVETGSFPIQARILSSFRSEASGNLLTAAFLALGGQVPTTPCNGTARVTMNTIR